MRKLNVLALSAITLAAVLAVSGAATAGPNGNGPKRDGNHGHWYKRACAIPASGVAACDAQVVTDSAGQPLASAATPSGMTPAQFHGAYSLPTTSASGTPTIGIVDAFNDPTIEADLATYGSQYGLPSCTTANGCFRKVNQTGGTSYPANNAGWSLEIALDVQTAHAICQNCHILLVEATTNSTANLGIAENEAVSLGATVVSNSWGGREGSSETNQDSAYFNHPGVPITFSSGDGGYGRRSIRRRHRTCHRGKSAARPLNVRRHDVGLGVGLVGRRFRLLGVRVEALVAARLGLLETDGGGRLGRRRSEHRCCRVRQQQRWLGPGRRDEPRLTVDRLGLRAHGHDDERRSRLDAVRAYLLPE